MKNNFENYSKKYYLFMLTFFGVFIVGQLMTSYYWDKELKLIDMIQLVLAPACCFSLASLIGIYRGKLMLIITSLYVWLIGSLLYSVFQKISFFKESDIFTTFITNSRLFGIPLAIQTVIAVCICYLIMKKKIKS